MSLTRVFTKEGASQIATVYSTNGNALCLQINFPLKRAAVHAITRWSLERVFCYLVVTTVIPTYVDIVTVP